MPVVPSDLALGFTLRLKLDDRQLMEPKTKGSQGSLLPISGLTASDFRAHCHPPATQEVSPVLRSSAPPPLLCSPSAPSLSPAAPPPLPITCRSVDRSLLTPFAAHSLPLPSTLPSLWPASSAHRRLLSLPPLPAHFLAHSAAARLLLCPLQRLQSCVPDRYRVYDLRRTPCTAACQPSYCASRALPEPLPILGTSSHDAVSPLVLRVPPLEQRVPPLVQRVLEHHRSVSWQHTAVHAHARYDK